MKRKTNMIIVTIIIGWCVFLSDWKITYKNRKAINEIEYNGLLWVILDYYSINRYRSSDKPIKWIKYTKNKV